MFSDKPSNCNLRKQDRDLSYLLNLNEGVETLEGGCCRYTIGLNIRVVYAVLKPSAMGFRIHCYI